MGGGNKIAYYGKKGWEAITINTQLYIMERRMGGGNYKHTIMGRKDLSKTSKSFVLFAKSRLFFDWSYMNEPPPVNKVPQLHKNWSQGKSGGQFLACL